MKTYRNSEIVSAYQLTESERLVTRDGVRDVDAGVWVLYAEDGVRLMDDAPFRARYDEWDTEPVEPENGGEAGQRDSGAVEPVEPLYSPVGRTVEEVTAYFRSGVSAEEIERVKTLESQTNSPRKGIMEFTG